MAVPPFPPGFSVQVLVQRSREVIRQSWRLLEATSPRDLLRPGARQNGAADDTRLPAEGEAAAPALQQRRARPDVLP